MYIVILDSPRSIFVPETYDTDRKKNRVITLLSIITIELETVGFCSPQKPITRGAWKTFYTTRATARFPRIYGFPEGMACLVSRRIFIACRN